MLLIFTFFILSMCAYSQDESPSKNGISNSEFILDLGINNWIDAPSGLKIKSLSRGVNLYIMRLVPFGTSNFGAAIGLGISSSNIYLDAMLGKDSLGVSTFTPISGVDYDKNKISTTYVDIPVELRFKTKPKNNKSFKVGVGIKGGYLVNSHTKYKGPDPSGLSTEKVKVKQLELDNFNDWLFSSFVRIGYGNTSLFASYSLNTLFASDKGPAIIPFSAGISISIP